VLREAAVAYLRGAVAGSQVYLLDQIESHLAGGAGYLTGAQLLLAAQDALRESNEHYGTPGALRTADAQEAASELALYFRLMASDFRAINDLTSEQPDDPDKRSPAHFDDAEREHEFKLWDDPPIESLSYATVGGRVFRFTTGCPAPVWELTNPCTYPDVARDLGRSAHTDFIYRFCYRACAGGPFQWPAQAGQVLRILGPAPPQPIELWDNDGIVNTASMLWPNGETVLVLADHLDVVGHYELVKAGQNHRAQAGDEPARIYRSYDALKSAPHLMPKTFEDIWTEIFEFSINPAGFATAGRKSRPTPVKLAGSVAAAC